ncbi:hypothetical protein SRHO_G00027290 [Serrasalmus rhombeus]
MRTVKNEAKLPCNPFVSGASGVVQCAAVALGGSREPHTITRTHCHSMWRLLEMRWAFHQPQHLVGVKKA